MKKKRSIEKACPANCSGGYTNMAKSVTPEQAGLPEDIKAKLTGSELRALRRCGYCNFVWVEGSYKKPLGYDEPSGFIIRRSL